MSETASSETGTVDPAREQRRRMALRHVRQFPDPVLRTPAVDVEEFDDELRALAERMWSIMDDAMGVGLAAPQVGLRLRMFTYRLDEDEEAGALINPVITSKSDETDIDEEGCLSLGELRIPVERPVAVTVSGKDLDGNDIELELEGFPARVMQHEIDHLDGVLMFDRAASDDARREALRYLRPRPTEG